MATEPFAVLGRRVLTPGGFAQDRAVIVREGRIAEILPRAALDDSVAVVAEADIVAPGFIDLQINGANDRLLNDDPSVEAIAAIAAGARKGGTAHLLPTLITSNDATRARAVAAMQDALAARVPGALGLHLEGPFIHPAKKGAHDPQWMRGAALADVEALSAPGVRLVTLAPERAQPGVIAALAARGVAVFAGHTDGTFADYETARAAGLSGFTHFFNAMSQMTARAPGAVGAGLAFDDCYLGLIADGLHVAPPNIALVARVKDHARILLVTDAMPTLGGARDHFMLDGRRIDLRDGMLIDAAGTLAGAHLAMDEAVANMTRFAEVPLESALRMASENPARAIGLGHELGKIAPGFRASLTLLGDDLRARRVVVDGALF